MSLDMRFAFGSKGVRCSRRLERAKERLGNDPPFALDAVLLHSSTLICGFRQEEPGQDLEPGDVLMLGHESLLLKVHWAHMAVAQK